MTSLSKVTGGPFDGKAVLRAIEDAGLANHVVVYRSVWELRADVG